MNKIMEHNLMGRPGERGLWETLEGKLGEPPTYCTPLQSANGVRSSNIVTSES